MVNQSLSGHDLFFLPTLGENYGHAVHEALAAGVPPLISDQTPWRDLDEKGVGFVRELDDPECFVAVIQNLALYTSEEQAALKFRAVEYARKISTKSEVADQNRKLFYIAFKE